MYLASGPPLPDPKRHFCNSMQASELCQKVLVSLKADLSFKVGASLMGSTFPSASFHVRFQYLHASMKPLNRFIRAKGKNNFTMRFSCRAFAASVKRRSIQDWTLQVHRQLMNSYFVGVQASWCVNSLLARPSWQTNRSFRGAGELWNQMVVRCVVDRRKDPRLQASMWRTLCWHDSTG